MASSKNQGLLMAFDFGLKKIGIAVGQAITKTATPIAIIKARDGIPDWSKIESLVGEWQPKRFVVGLPLNMDDSDSEMSELAKKFGRRLYGRFHIPVEMMDERLTSFEAKPSLEVKPSFKVKPSFEVKKSSNEPFDHVAAKLILESYFRHRDE